MHIEVVKFPCLGFSDNTRDAIERRKMKVNSLDLYDSDYHRLVDETTT